jgi:hypothetical protein
VAIKGEVVRPGGDRLADCIRADRRKPVLYVIMIQNILGKLPVVPVGDMGTIPHHLSNAFRLSQCTRRPQAGMGDGCRIWFVNSWAGPYGSLCSAFYINISLSLLSLSSLFCNNENNQIMKKNKSKIMKNDSRLIKRSKIIRYRNYENDEKNIKLKKI